MKTQLAAAMTLTGAAFSEAALAQTPDGDLLFETVIEIVEVDTPRLVWKEGADLSDVTRADPRTGRMHSLVAEPTRRVAVTRRRAAVGEASPSPEGAAPLSARAFDAAPLSPQDLDAITQDSTLPGGAPADASSPEQLAGAPRDGGAQSAFSVTPLPPPLAIDAAPQRVATANAAARPTLRRRLSW
ncbi:MAG: hypothetical protein SGJ21_15930 [Alphaproteobacteria bacterium]|nr:hypothetical protein [Alphaproteobacteria bacterium]